MIPELNLDNQNVKDIFDTMLARMSQYYAGDMDCSYQEPSVALLEIFCVLKDMQQFYLNFVSDKHKMRYIELLGGCSMEQEPAKTTLTIVGTGNVPKGSKVYAENICFETINEIDLSANKICSVVLEIDGEIAVMPIWNRPFYAFGKNTGNGCLYIGFEYDVYEKAVGGIFFELERVRPNLYVPLGEIQLSFFSENEKWEVVHTNDETQGFSINGNINFGIPIPMKSIKIGDREAYWVRIELVKNDFEILPRLTGIYLNAVTAQQTITLAETRRYLLSNLTEHSEKSIELGLDTFLARNGRIELQKMSDGDWVEIETNDYDVRASEQIIQLPAKYFGEEILIIATEKDYDTSLTRLNGTPKQQIICINGDGVQKIQVRRERDGKWEIWNRCKDLEYAGPLDKSFVVKDFKDDNDKKLICFGNDENGAIPPVGEARIIDCILTMGAKGNIRRHAIDTSLVSGLEVTNINSGVDGRDALSVTEALQIIKKRTEYQRAITLEDYNKLVLAMPSLDIDCAMAVCDNNAIAIYIKPKSFRTLPTLNESYKKSIRAYLEPFRILTTQIDIHSPKYLGIIIYTELVITSAPEVALKQIKESIYTFIPKTPDRFFKSISHGALYGLIRSLPFVKRIDSILLEQDGRFIKTGFYEINPGGMAYIKDLKITLTVE